MLTRRQIERLDDDRLLVKIMEEASEVTKALAKHFAHGERPTFRRVKYDNVKDVNEEAAQMNALLEEYRGRFGDRGHPQGESK